MLFADGHHIIVGHHHRRGVVMLARPAQQQSPTGKPLEFADLKHLGV